MMQNADNLGAISSFATFVILILIITGIIVTITITITITVTITIITTIISTSIIIMSIFRREHVAVLLDVLLHSLYSNAPTQVVLESYPPKSKKNPFPFTQIDTQEQGEGEVQH